MQRIFWTLCCALWLASWVLTVAICPSSSAADEPRPVSGAAPRLPLLFLGGSSGSHRPAEMARLIERPLQARGIHVTYTEEVASLSPEKLAAFEAVAIYKDDGELPAAAEAALLQFVEGGRGLVAIHCASHAFRNSPRYGALVGGRFAQHGRARFAAQILDAHHPALRDVRSFATDDETYVHNELADDIRVLMGRDDGGRYEPYTWVRRQGRGRVYYTALGHDEKTWSQFDFQRQLAQAIRWAAGRLPEDQPPVSIVDGKPGPLSPADSMRHMHLAAGFRVELFAAEPEIVKPLTMTFDERGRAWIVESVDYPNDVKEPFAGSDRIKICEDTDGDGRADKFTVFAEGLNIPTGLLKVDGGLIVALAPHIVYFSDTDGDDRADDQKILYTGFGRFDTHAVHSNFRWGPDNWIWATVGYSGGEVTVGGKTHKFKQSIFRFKPDGSALEVLTPTSNNTWGLGFDAAGVCFASTANNQHAVHLAIPNRYLEAVRGLTGIGSAGIEDHKVFHHLSDDLRQVDFHGGYTAAAGFTVLTSDTLPEHLRDRAALVCEPTGHLVHVDFLVPRGAGFVARDGYNLLASTDPWTAPIETHLGPDGSIWMIDWYNYIVRHNPTPAGFKTGAGNAYITPERDKSHGRIYRLVPQKAQSLAPRLNTADETALVTMLGHGNSWRRYQAQRLLVERGRRDGDARQRICAAVRARIIEAQARPMLVVHGLWVLNGLDGFKELIEKPDQFAAEAIQLSTKFGDSHPAVRRAMALNVPNAVFEGRLFRRRALPASLLLGDVDPQVRLAALLAAAEAEKPVEPKNLVAALSLSPPEADHWLNLAAICAAARTADTFLAAVAEQTEFPVSAAPVLQAVAEHHARTPERAGDVVGVVARLGSAPSHVALAIIQGLADGWPKDDPPALDEERTKKLVALLPKLTAEAQFELVELAERWRLGESFAAASQQIRQALLAEMAAADTTAERRAAIVGQVVGMCRGESEGDLAALVALVDQVTPRAAPEIVRAIFAGLGSATHPGLGSEICARWSTFTPGARQAATGLLMRRPLWTAALLDAVAAGTIDRGELAIDVAQRLVAHPDDKLAARAKELLAKDASPQSSDRDAILQQLLPLAEKSGDAAGGRAVFEKNCAKCHRLGDLGQAVGPDLTGINVRPRAAILTEILDPNRSVEGNYRQYTVATSDGQVFSGLMVAETGTAIELLDSQAERHQILREDIEELAASTKSVMPEGFEKLSADELVNLLTFLADRGKYVPLSLGKAANVVTTRGMFNDFDVDVERLIFARWGPQTFAGVPFQVADPRNDSVPNAIELYSPIGGVSRTMPKAAAVECGLPAKAVHLLGGVAGWAYPLGRKDSVSLIVRLHYRDSVTEDHPLRNGVHIADYIRRVDVPESQLAFMLRDQQLRYLTIVPKRAEPIARVEFVKGDDDTAPVIMAVTVETAGE